MFDYKNTPELIEEPEYHPVSKQMLAAADRIEAEDWLGRQDYATAIALWLRREAHLCTARYLELVQSGAPSGTAEFLAQDDMGLQLAASVARIKVD